MRLTPHAPETDGKSPSRGGSPFKTSELEPFNSGSRRGPHRRSLEAELRDRYIAGGGWERVSYKQLEPAAALIRYLSRARARSDGAIDRTVPEIAKRLGRPVEGLTVRQIRDRWEDQITAALKFLQIAGYIDHVVRDVRNPDGSGRCIVVYLRAGVAQSVRATEMRSRAPRRRSAPEPPRSSLCAKFPPPSGGAIGGLDPQSLIRLRSERLKTAGARARLGTRDRALLRFPVRAALKAATTADPEGTGRALLEARPELVDAPVEIVAREAWRAAGHGDGRLSSRGSRRLERAVAQLERVGYAGLTGPAASRAAVIDLALGDWGDHWWHAHRLSSDKPPVTLGGLVFCLRRLAHELATGARLRRRRRLAGD